MPIPIQGVESTQKRFLGNLEGQVEEAQRRSFRAMANRPEVLKTFVPLYGAIMEPGPG